MLVTVRREQEARSEALAQDARARVAEAETERLGEQAAVYKEAYERRRFLFGKYPTKCAVLRVCIEHGTTTCP